MMQKRKFSSLLLISFIVVFSFSFAAANTVDFGESTQLRCDDALQNISITNAQEIVGFEIILEISGDYTGLPSVTFGAAVPASWSTYTDYRVDGIAPDTIRFAAIRLNSGDPALAAGTYDVATLNITTAEICNGAISIAGGDWTDYSNPTGTITTQFIDAGSVIYAAATTGGDMTITNEPPTLAEITDQELTWDAPGNVLTGVTAVGSDGDLANICETLTYTLITFPEGMEIVEETGVITWTADGEDVCLHFVEVQVEDECGITATTTFNICVSNEAPTVDGLATILVSPGEVAEGDFDGTDPDEGPNPLLYEIVSFDGPGFIILDPATGEFSWEVPEDISGEIYNVVELCVSVSDQTPLCFCNDTNADTACVTIEVIPLRYVIEKTHGTIQGGFTTVDIMMPNTLINYPIGGFEFLIQYDASALSFMGAEAGSFIVNCGWEYFTYRTGPFGNCGSACPSGMVKLVGLAETNNGDNHPVAGCTNTVGNEQIASLRFLVTSDRNFECQYLPIRFFWIDCADNSVSDETGAHLFWGRRVFDYDGPNDPGHLFNLEYYTEAVAPEGYDIFPSIYGPTTDCDEIDDAKNEIYSYIDFFNGGIDIVCADSIDDRGDLNLDGLAYTVADAVMYTNYFVYGMQALHYVGTENKYGVIPGYAGSVAASDVNGDGLTLSVADLVTLIRVIVGDENPLPKPAVDATITYTNSNVISVGDVKMGAAYVVVAGDAIPSLLADGMDMKVSFDGQNTNVLVYNIDGNTFNGEFLAAGGDIVSLEIATADGAPVLHKLIPTEFDLAQNYPNPFNPSTAIAFNMPLAGDYALTIYNVTGQVVAEFNGTGSAGVEEVIWNASSNASGVYFYKLTMDSYSATKKMVLLK